jgi:hypothetical protein
VGDRRHEDAETRHGELVDTFGRKVASGCILDLTPFGYLPSLQRRQEYCDWATAVVGGLPKVGT